MEVIKIVMLGMAGVLLGLLLRESRPEYSVYLSLAVGIYIFFSMTSQLSDLFSALAKLEEYLPLDVKYLTLLLKMIGVTYIAEFSSGICRDAGYRAVAGQIEMFAKLYIMVLSVPVLLALLETIHGFLT